MRFKLPMLVLLFVAVTLTGLNVEAAVVNADPSNYQTLLTTLKPGDTMELAPGTYTLLNLNNLNGTPDAWITITGPTSGSQAIIQGTRGSNTVEIVNCSYLAIENLVIDSRHYRGIFGLSAKGGTTNSVHDILVEGNHFINQDATQQTDGISTKTPTWNWTISHNTIDGAGTGLYLGNSDGSDPFINGVIENNLVENTIGYDMEIKYQLSQPSIPELPGPNTTIIRNNTFIKNDQRSPDGDRPNVLVGGFPSSGPGMDDLYQIYGNFFDHNPREALFQGSGRVAIHDNVFVDAQYTAIALQDQDLPLKLAYVYNNTIYTSQAGITFGNTAAEGDDVVGNLVFAATPITGPIVNQSDNMIDTVANAVNYVNSPTFTMGQMNFYPLSGKCTGTAMDLSSFNTEADYSIDFNGMPKDTGSGVIYRGAYAGSGVNPGWQLQAGIKL